MGNFILEKRSAWAHRRQRRTAAAARSAQSSGHARSQSLSRNSHAHPAPERILPARHFGHRKDGRASGRRNWRSVIRSPWSPAALRTIPTGARLPLCFAAPRLAQQSGRRMRRLDHLFAPPNASARHELSFLSRARRAARAALWPGHYSGHDRSSRRGHRGRVHRAARRPAIRLQHSRPVPGHGHRRRHRPPQQMGRRAGKTCTAAR